MAINWGLVLSRFKRINGRPWNKWRWINAFVGNWIITKHSSRSSEGHIHHSCIECSYCTLLSLNINYWILIIIQQSYMFVGHQDIQLSAAKCNIELGNDNAPFCWGLDKVANILIMFLHNPHRPPTSKYPNLIMAKWTFPETEKKLIGLGGCRQLSDCLKPPQPYPLSDSVALMKYIGRAIHPLM